MKHTDRSRRDQQPLGCGIETSSVARWPLFFSPVLVLEPVVIPISIVGVGVAVVMLPIVGPWSRDWECVRQGRGCWKGGGGMIIDSFPWVRRVVVCEGTGTSTSNGGKCGKCRSLAPC